MSLIVPPQVKPVTKCASNLGTGFRSRLKISWKTRNGEVSDMQFKTSGCLIVKSQFGAMFNRCGGKDAPFSRLRALANISRISIRTLVGSSLACPAMRRAAIRMGQTSRKVFHHARPAIVIVALGWLVGWLSRGSIRDHKDLSNS